MNLLQLPAAWDITTGSSEVVVAVIDTGVDVNQPDLAGNIWSNPKEKQDGVDNDKDGFIDDLNGWNFVDNNPNVRPIPSEQSTKIGLSHGTVVAGLIGATGNNYLGTAGVSWRVRIMPLKILDEAGNGDSDAAVKAIDYAILHKADIINLSFVGPTPSLNFIQAIRRAYRAGIPVIAAAGNGPEGAVGVNLDETPQYPVCFDDPLREEDWVIGVAALGENGLLAPFSNYGARCLDLATPGWHIPSTLYFEPNQGYDSLVGGSWSGSSIAAPFVAGAAALIKGLQPTWGTNEIRKALVNTVDPLPGNDKLLAGRGSLNIYSAVKYALQGGDGGVPAGVFVGVGQPTKAGLTAKIFDTKLQETKSFVIAPATTRGQVNVTAADIRGSGVANIVAAVPDKRGSLIRIFTRDGKLLKEFRPFGKSYTGAFPLVTNDFDHDGKDEIVVAPGKGGYVLVMSGQGEILQQINLPASGNLYLAVVRDQNQTRLITAIDTQKQLEVYLWDRYGSFVSYLELPRPVGVIRVGVMPEVSEFFYVAGLQGGKIRAAIYNAAGEEKMDWQAQNKRPIFDYAFGRLAGQDDMLLVVGVAQKNILEFTGYNPAGEVAISKTLKNTAIFKWQNLIYTR